MSIQEAIQKARDYGTGKTPLPKNQKKIKYRQNNDVRKQERLKFNYSEMTIEKLRELEKQASDWLVANKLHPDFNKAKKRYDILVKNLNFRAEAGM